MVLIYSGIALDYQFYQDLVYINRLQSRTQINSQKACHQNQADIKTNVNPKSLDVRATRLDSAILGPENPVIVSVIVINLNNICSRFWSTLKHSQLRVA